MILNPAAYTAVDKAESEPEMARAINAEAPGILGEEARKLNARIIHFSTDYVFPGEGTQPYLESDATAPLNVYGATKLAGEQALAASGASHVILRTSWVYAGTGKNFLLTVLRIAAQRAAAAPAGSEPEPMNIVADQHGAPTSALELARLTQHLLNHGAVESGVYHAAGAGETTWFGFAQEAIRQQLATHPGLHFTNLLPIPTSAYPTPARRPLNSRLDCTKLERACGFRFKSWQDALSEILHLM